MKTLVMLSFLVIVCTSCGILTPQETQEERQRLLAAHDEARQKHNPEKVKQAVKDLLIGKWQYLGLEVEEGSIAVQKGKSNSQQKLDPPNALVNTPAKAATSKQIPGTNAEEQSAAPNSPSPETNEQTSVANPTRLPQIEVTDEKSNQRILGAKAALVASTRQNLTLEFAKNRGSYHYAGSDRGTNVTGQCYVTTKRYGDEPLPFISFNRRTGPEMLEFLFGSESVKQMAAKQKQKRVSMIRNSKTGIRAARKAAAKQSTSYTIALMPGITVTKDRLYLVLYGDMELTPKGWRRTGMLRCTFKRIE